MKRYQIKLMAMAVGMPMLMMLTASSAMASAPLIECPVYEGGPGGGIVMSTVPPTRPYLGQAIAPENAEWSDGYQGNIAALGDIFPDGFKMNQDVFSADKLNVHINGGFSFVKTPFVTDGLAWPKSRQHNSPTIMPYYSNVEIPPEWDPDVQDGSNVFICLDKPNKRLIVTWYYVRKEAWVGEVGQPEADQRNTFQAILKNSSDSCGDSNNVLDIEFRYHKLEWFRWGANKRHDAILGVDLGTYNGLPVPEVTYYQLPYSYDLGYFDVLTDSTPASSPPGVHRFRVKDGQFAPAGPAVCGDGMVDSCSEECDLGAENSDNGACTSACKIARCGDGLVQIGVEQCDRSSLDPAHASCPAGYSGTPLCKNHPQNPNQDGTCTLAAIPDGCTDINECVQTPGLCGAGSCTNTPGSYTCNCPTGYTFDGTTCVDVDECTTTIPGLQHDCQGTSTCVNSVGSYSCTCPSGYFYNGVTCTDIDRCADTTFNTCQGTSTCVNIPGGIECTCPSGYRYDGTTCVDIDECTESPASPCKDTSTCVNTPGSFTCECAPGYAYINEVCEKIDECTDPTLNSCQGTSICVETPIGHTCVCGEIGFEYDGTTCVDIDECADPDLNTCDENAICTNTDGGYACACDEGFAGDGHSCEEVDVDACADPELNTCDENATCTNTVDGYECACNEGFTGDGQSCEEVNVDACADPELNTCDENATCTNTADGHSCACNEGFSGDGQTCTKDEIPVVEEDEPQFGPIMGGGLACSAVPNHMNTTLPAGIVLGLAGLFMIRRRRRN